MSLYCLIVYLCSSILFLWNTCLFTRHYNTIYNLLHWKNLLLRIIHYITTKTNYNSGPRNLQIDQINRPQASYVPPGADKRSFKFHFIASPPLIWQSTAVTGGGTGTAKCAPHVCHRPRLPQSPPIPSSTPHPSCLSIRLTCHFWGDPGDSADCVGTTIIPVFFTACGCVLFLFWLYFGLHKLVHRGCLKNQSNSYKWMQTGPIIMCLVDAIRMSSSITICQELFAIAETVGTKQG